MCQRKRGVLNFTLKFDDNRANLGAAIFINDYTYICKHSACFIQAPLSCWDGWIKINNANKNSAIYDGLLDRCKVEDQYFENDFISAPMNGIDYIIGATNNTSIKNIISSQPVRICYCNGRNVSCNNKRKILDVKKGETFKVAVAALDQASHMVDAPVFITSMQKYVYHQEMVQQVQMTKKECSNITLKASSPNDSVELTIHANSPCKDDEISEAITLHINFKNCTCPIGFQSQLQEVCVCDCDQQIKPFINTCNPSSMSLLRQGDFWIDYFNNTQYLIYPHCPYDYCLPSTHDINISLNIPNGVDDQCALNRTRLYCAAVVNQASVYIWELHNAYHVQNIGLNFFLLLCLVQWFLVLF